MVLGVPLFATVLELSDAYLDKRLRKKGIVETTANGGEEQPRKGLVSRFKKKAIRLHENRADGGEGDLTRLEKLQLEAYSLAVKYHIFSESSDDALSRYTAEKNALLQAVESADKILDREFANMDSGKE